MFFREMDLNGSGKISMKELAKFFNRYYFGDKDGSNNHQNKDKKIEKCCVKL